MKKMLFVLGSLGKGGAERVASLICNHFAKAGVDVSIAMLLSNKVCYPLEPSIKLLDFSRKKRNFLSGLCWIESLKKEIRKTNPDYIISFAGRINVLTLLSCRKNKVIVSERNDPRFDNRSKLLVKICDLLYGMKAKCVVFQSNEVMRQFSKRTQNKGSIVLNPIKKPNFFKNDYHHFEKIIMVGRLSPQKNYSMAIKGFLLASQKVGADLYVYGNGELETRLKREFAMEPNFERVHFMGQTDEPEKKMSEGDLFLLTSKYEGLSNSLMEAMALGLPCISTPVAGSSELVHDGQNGVLLKGFSAEELSEAIIRLGKNSELRKKIGERSKEDMASCYEEKIMKQWKKMLEES